MYASFSFFFTNCFRFSARSQRRFSASAPAHCMLCCNSESECANSHLSPNSLGAQRCPHSRLHPAPAHSNWRSHYRCYSCSRPRRCQCQCQSQRHRHRHRHRQLQRQDQEASHQKRWFRSLYVKINGTFSSNENFIFSFHVFVHGSLSVFSVQLLFANHFLLPICDSSPEKFHLFHL